MNLYERLSNKLSSEFSRPSDSDVDEKDAFIAPNMRPKKRFWKRSWFLLSLITVPWLVNVIAMILLFQVHKSQQSEHSKTMPVVWPQLLYSPAQHVANDYKIEKFHHGFGYDKSIYQGPPSPERDQAWDDLYNFGQQRITKYEASLLPNKTHAIPGDEDHYVVVLDVFHELHCLNKLRKFVWKEYYKGTDEYQYLNVQHMEHCIDTLRASIMCASDISVIVWQWHENYQQFMARGDIVHSCRNFDAIRDWALERTVTNEQLNQSIHILDDIHIKPF